MRGSSWRWVSYRKRDSGTTRCRRCWSHGPTGRRWCWPDSPQPQCRLCRAPLGANEQARQLCAVCDEYAQHVAIRSNRQFDRIVGELQTGTLFLRPREAH